MSDQSVSRSAGGMAVALYAKFLVGPHVDAYTSQKLPAIAVTNVSTASGARVRAHPVGGAGAEVADGVVDSVLSFLKRGNASTSARRAHPDMDA